MSYSSKGESTRGGSFCRFTVGSGEPGASLKSLRYIANPQAVKDGREGVWLQGFPPLLAEAPYSILVGHLCGWAQWSEQEEFIIGLSKYNQNQKVRTHYTAILSFEVSVSTPQAKEMLTLWMERAFPKAQAAAFVHRNTRHLHLHVWIAARQTDGKKINLSARAFRQLDETWNRIYSGAMNRDEREHLLKKGETERWKQLRREGKVLGLEKPERVAHDWNPAEFNERERERSGGNTRETIKEQEGDYDVNETGVGGDQRGITAGIDRGKSRSRGSEARDPAVEEAFRQEQKAVGKAQRTVSELARLHRDVERVGELVQKRTPDLEPER